MIDVLPRPAAFSFADAIAVDLGIEQRPCPVPFAISYRVGEPVPDGTLLASWVRPFHVGDQLPAIPLALDRERSIEINLEQTYGAAAKRVYLS